MSRRPTASTVWSNGDYFVRGYADSTYGVFRGDENLGTVKGLTKAKEMARGDAKAVEASRFFFHAVEPTFAEQVFGDKEI